MQPDFSLYDILGVTSTATAEEIKAAYRASVLKYHPDVNKAPNAQRLTEMLNSAYEVLSDPEKRREYDGHLESGTAVNESGEPAEEMWDLLVCDRCGRPDAQLRFANFFRVWSIIVYTRMNGIGGVLCPGCRSVRAMQSALFSGTLGPWGFPWGIFYTIRALVAAARGGEFSRLENAQLLRHQGIAFIQRGLQNEAFTNFTDSLKFEKNDSIASLLSEPFFNGATRIKKPGWLLGQSIGLASFAIPVIILMLLGLWAASSPSTATSNTTTSSSGY